MKIILASFTRLILIFLVSYIGISHIFWYTSNPNTFATNSTLKQTLIILTKPLDLIAPNQNLIQTVTWSEVAVNIANQDIIPLEVTQKATNSNLVDYLWYTKEFALISPQTKSSEWFLISCQKNLTNCKQLDLRIKTKVRVKTTNTQILIGKTLDGKFFNLDLNGYFSGGDYDFYPLI